MKMTKRDIAGYLGVDYKTLFNWEKERPNLYKTVMLGLAVDNIIEQSQKNLDDLKSLKSTLGSQKLKKEKQATNHT